MVETERKLPEYSEPPVIETVVGVQFSPLSGFTVAHLGLFWPKIRDRYPHVEVHPPLSPVSEQFSAETRKAPSIGFEIVQAGEVRCWFIDATQTHLIQVQTDRFILNWRKVLGDEPYPRYKRFRPRFEEEWRVFCQFLTEEGINTPEVNLCEITYINHFEKGREWKSFHDVSNVLSCWKEWTGEFLPEPEFVRLNTRYILPNNQGRLHVFLQPAIRRRDGKEILQFSLTARGKPPSSDLEDIVKCFDLGHDWIVNGFTDLTTRGMHTLWGRTR